MTQRIFISSLMRGFADERNAAKEAITRLRQQPVMAEDFGAQPVSSQTACLEGVRNSDIYVGIYAERYGYVAPTSGLAATEEEFQEARRRGMPILCFEKKGAKEPQQETFLNKIKAYETGYAFAFFDSAADLKMQIVQALHDVIGNPGVSMLDPTSATAALDRHQWGSHRADQYATWFGAVLVPARQGEVFFDVLDFGRKDVRDRLLQPALLGGDALFKLEHGVIPSEKGNALLFSQEVNRQRVAKLEIHTDGALVYGSSLRSDSGGFSLGQNYIINEDVVEERLIAFIGYADKHYKSLGRGQLIASIYFGGSLTGLEHKTFGKLPAYPLNSFSVPMHRMADPLRIPPTPLQIARAELAASPSLAHKITEHAARLFRHANAYYTPDGGRR